MDQTSPILDIIQESNEIREKLVDNMNHFRNEMNKLGFNILPGNHPVIPIMLGDAALGLAQK